MTEVIKGLKGWTLKITCIKYCAEALAFVPWVALKNLAAEKKNYQTFGNKSLNRNR